MNLENNKVVITGGATGIGLGIAEIFLNAGSKVIICGRRQEALNSAVRKHPTLISYQCDVSSSAERTSFVQRDESSPSLVHSFPSSSC